MVTCRYVGLGCAQVGELEYDTIGQRASFSEDVFYQVILGGAEFLPEEEYQRAGFTAEDIRAYGAMGERVDSSDSFLSKVDFAHKSCSDLRLDLLRSRSNALAAVTDSLPD